MTGDVHHPLSRVFDGLFDTGAPEVLAGTHRRDKPPVEGGRWPVSVVALPPEQMRDRLDRWTMSALRYAGPRHFATGLREAVHLTVRALEPYRDAAAPTDPVVDTWLDAVRRTARATAPIPLVFTGITLSSSGVLAQLEPADDSAWTLMERLREELGAEAWYEDGWHKRDIWYASLLHFADRIEDPPGLINWVRRHRAITPTPFMIDSLALVRFRHGKAASSRAGCQQLMRPEIWAMEPLIGTSRAGG